jgi:hypothetical protein
MISMAVPQSTTASISIWHSPWGIGRTRSRGLWVLGLSDIVCHVLFPKRQLRFPGLRMTRRTGRKGRALIVAHLSLKSLLVVCLADWLFAVSEISTRRGFSKCSMALRIRAAVHAILL